MNLSKLLRRVPAPGRYGREAAIAATLFATTFVANADFFIAYDLDNGSGWTFNHPMTLTAGTNDTWTTEVNVQSGNKAFFTFFDGEVEGWNNLNGHSRYGEPGKGEPIVVSGQEYAIEKGKTDCYEITTKGKYSVSLVIAPNATTGKITFTLIDENPDPDPDPEPEPDPIPTDNCYIYFHNKDNWSDIKVWAWNGTGNCNANGTWPGDSMTQKGDFWYWEAPAGKVPTQIIISTNNGGTKAGDKDLDFYNGQYYLPDGNHQATAPVINPDPDPDPEPDPVPGHKAFIPSPTDANYHLIENASDYVFFVNEDDWDRVQAYSWFGAGDSDSNRPGGGWPGASMTKYQDNIYVWVNTSGKDPQKIIFNNNSTQTGNLEYKSRATYYPDGSIYEIPAVPEYLGAVTGWQRNSDVVEIECENGTIFITPYSKQIVKVFTLQKGSNAAERTSITVTATPEADFTVSENSYDINITITDGAAVSVAKENSLISFYENATGAIRLSEASSLINGKKCSVAFNPQDDLAFYGGGPSSRAGSIKDQTIVLNNKQKWGWNSYYNEEHNIEIPFVVSTSNYGVLFDDHYRYAKMMPKSTGLSYESGSKNPISYYYIGGDSMDEIVANYSHLTGRQPLPPYWALGYITSRYGYKKQSEAENVIRDIKACDIPLDGLVFDLYWQGADEGALGTLDWYRPNFPNPSEMLSKWKQEKGVHTILITEPYFTDKCSNWNYLKNTPGMLADEHVSDNGDMSWLKPNHDVGLLDASNPAALDWMYTFYKARTQEGVDGWWLDLGEPEGYDEDSNHLGGTPSQVHNEFGQLWVGHIYDCLHRDFPDMRHFLMPRAGTSGMHRYAAFPWTGDIERSWSGFEAQIPSLINMSMAGFSYIGSDVGGFACTNGEVRDAKLYLRWVQFGALSPMLRTHSAVDPEPYNSAYSSVLPQVRDAIRLRYRMLPYTYTLAYENSAYGYPMARPACALDQDKSLLADNNNSYLWGRDLFVAPFLSYNDSRSITFPEGEWLDMNEVLKGDVSSVYRGHTTVNYSGGNDCIPFFMRKGSFIPMFAQSDFNNTSELDYGDLVIHHYIDYDNPSEGIIYEDDRTNPRALEEDNYSLIRIHRDHEVITDPEEESSDNAFIFQINQEGDESVLPEMRTIHLYLHGWKGSDMYGIAGDLPNSQKKPRPTPEEPEPEETPQNARMYRVEEPPTKEEFSDAKIMDSLDDAKNFEGHAIYLDDDKDMVYVKLHNIPSTSNLNLKMIDVPTAVKSIYDSGMKLTYSNGTFNYMVDPSAVEAEIEVFSADGRLIATIPATSTDGTVHSAEAPSFSGFCIARLSARDTSGNRRSTTCKAINN